MAIQAAAHALRQAMQVFFDGPAHNVLVVFYGTLFRYDEFGQRVLS